MADYSDASNRNPTDVPANEIVKALKGIDFPANKDKMVNKARENDAPNTVIEALRKLPGRDFNSPVDVEKAYSDIQNR